MSYHKLKLRLAFNNQCSFVTNIMIISFVFHSFISRRSFNFEITRVISQQTALSQSIFIKNFPCQCNRKLIENDVENIQTDLVRQVI